MIVSPTVIVLFAWWSFCAARLRMTFSNAERHYGS